MRSIVICCLLLLSVPGTAQRTLVVHSTGPYTTIQAAVNAASAGDIVLVRPGTYFGATITKGLQLLGESTPTLISNLVIRGIPQGERVAVKRFSMLSSSRYSPVQVMDCRGTVHLASIKGGGSPAGPALLVRNCAQVSATNSQFDAQHFLSWNRVSGGKGLIVESSSLLLKQCTMHGKSTRHRSGSQTSYFKFEGVLASSSRLVLIDCSASGAPGYCYPFMFCIQTPPFAAIQAAGCTIVAKRTSLVGGKGSFADCYPCGQGQAPAVTADPSTRVIRDSQTLFTVFGGQTIVQDLFDLQANGRPPGQAIPITIRGPRSAPYAVFANFGIQPFGAPIGTWLDVNNVVLLFADYMNRSHTTQLTTPAYLPRGMPVVLQAAVFLPQTFELSTPAAVILD